MGFDALLFTFECHLVQMNSIFLAQFAALVLCIHTHIHTMSNKNTNKLLDVTHSQLFILAIVGTINILHILCQNRN